MLQKSTKVVLDFFSQISSQSETAPVYACFLVMPCYPKTKAAVLKQYYANMKLNHSPPVWLFLQCCSSGSYAVDVYFL